MTEIYRYLHCVQCLDEQKPPSLEAGASQDGALVIKCATHGTDLLTIEKVGDALASEPCHGWCEMCGKETIH